MTYKLEGIAQSRKVIQSNSGLSIELWKEGSLFGFYFKEVMVNLFQGNYLTGGWTNVYLTKKGQNQSAIPFIGREHVYAYQTNGVLYARKDKDFYSVLRVSLDKDLPIIYFDISIEALQEVVLSPCLFLDLGLAPKGHVASNELYNSHYIDHTVLQHPQYGQVICSRQTQNVGGHPWAMIASSGKGVRYCTDGLAFWGNRVREGQKDPEFLINSNQSHLIQGELSSVALESQEIELKAGQTQQVRFVVFLEENHIEPSSSEDIQKLDQVNWAKEGACFQFNSVQADMSGQSFSYIGERDLQTDSLSAQEVEQKWPSREYEERGEKGELLSFFSGTCRHIVMKEKELIQERATGTVLFSGKKLALEPECLSVTNIQKVGFVDI